MKQRTKKSQTILRAGLILGIIILINIISIRIFGRLDLTGHSIYTLSQASKNLVKKLDDKITVKVYFTADLPAPYNNNRRFVLDMLNDYKAYAGGNLQYEFIDPQSEELQREAQSQGIPPVEIQVIQNDKYEVKKAFMGLICTYEDKKEIQPIIQSLETLEYDLTGAFKRLTQKEKKDVGFTVGHQETDMQNLQVIYNATNKQYNLQQVDLVKSNEISPDIKVLVIMDPKVPFNDTAKYAIDQYLIKGGSLALLTGKIKIDMAQQNPQAKFVDLGLDAMLANYGIHINNDLVKDVACATITVARSQQEYQIQSNVKFPYMPTIMNFSKDNMIGMNLKNVIFQFASSIDTTMASSRGMKSQVIAMTSDKSGRDNGSISINPFKRWTEQEFAEKYIPVAALFSGSLKSFYEGKQPPASITKSPETKIVVVGCGSFAENNLAQYSDNLSFFANIIDYLADDSGLISIRAKNATLSPLEEVSDGTKKMLKYGNMIVPPVIVILWGLFRWRRRVAIKRSIESQL